MDSRSVEAAKLPGALASFAGAIASSADAFAPAAGAPSAVTRRDPAAGFVAAGPLEAEPAARPSVVPPVLSAEWTPAPPPARVIARPHIHDCTTNHPTPSETSPVAATSRPTPSETALVASTTRPTPSPSQPG